MTQHKRYLKLQEEHCPRAYKRCRIVPTLKLSGVWLEQAGFGIGKQIEITVQENQLIIKPAE